MALQKKPSDINPAAQYRVKLTAKVTVGLLKLNPRHDCVVRGDVLLTILDKVESYDIVE